MSRYLFLAFLLLLAMCYTCGPAWADIASYKRKVKLFVPMETKVPDSAFSENPTRTVESFYSPSVVVADGVIVALADADYTNDYNDNIDIAARYIETKGADWVKKVTVENGYHWKTQLLPHKEKGQWNFSFLLKKPVSIVKDNKIYVLVLNYKKDKRERNLSKYLDWRFELAVGEVKPTGGSPGTGKTIVWRTPVILANLTQQLKDNLVNVPLYANSYGFLRSDGKLVFAVEALKENKLLSVIIHLNDTETGIKMDWLYVETADDCYPPAFFVWGGKLIMVPHCLNGTYKVKESADFGKTWADATWPMLNMWTRVRNKRDITSVIIEREPFLLFTEKVDQGKPSLPKYEIRLWFSDGNRVHEVGTIITRYTDVYSYGLLYTNGELFFLHQEWYGMQPKDIVLTRLNDELDTIKSVLKIWSEKDEYLYRPCRRTAPLDATLETPCVTPMPSDGLVGFLSNYARGGTWQDEYLFMNAAVIGGRKVVNGLTFNGVGSGARWPVGEYFPYQWYNASEYGLNIVATVTMHAIPGGNSPLLTFGGVWGDKRPGLWCDKYKNWRVLSERGLDFAGAWEVNKTYQLALEVNKNRFSFFVDGRFAGSMVLAPAPWRALHDIQQFYIGGYDDKSAEPTTTYMTVTNVLLYNRPLNQREILVLDRKLREFVNPHTKTNMIEVYVPKETKLPRKVGYRKLKKLVQSFSSPSLVVADGLMAVIADADYAFGGNENIDIAARYIGVEGANWVERATEDIGYNWETQLVMQKEEHWDFSFSLRRPMSVAKDNKIYVLVLNYKKDKRERNLSKYLDWGFELAVGEVKPTGGSPGTGKTIVWRTLVTLSKLTQQLKDNSVNVPQDGDSYSFLANDGKFVFVVQALKENKNVSIIIRMSVTVEFVKTQSSYVETGEGCSFPSFFLWGGKLTMVPHCLDGTYKMKESADMGRTWANATWLPARLWGNLKERGHFTSATIENKTALLFTQPVQTKPNSMWYDIHLWVTDGNRVEEVGKLYAGFGFSIKFVDSARLFYTNGELIALCLSRTWGPWETGIYFQPLKYELERIRSVLKAWAETDKYLSKPCVETVPLDASLETPCVTPMPTDGLVGFLSNTTTGDIWQDEYFFVNATVKGGIKVDNGFKFYLTGSGSGANWVLRERYPNKRYNFVNNGFTLLATAVIYEIPLDESRPLLTLNGFWDNKPLGLWYNNNKTWKVVSQKGETTSMGVWKTDKAYRVALVLRQNAIFVYVDGSLLGRSLRQAMPGERMFDIDYVFFGGYEDSSAKPTISHVAITNVFLYNRQFNDTELEALEYALQTGPPNVVELLAPGKTKVPEKMGDENQKKDVVEFLSSSLVAVDGVMIALAEADYTYDDDTNSDIAARYIETEGENWVERANADNGGNWKTQLVMQKVEVNYVSWLKHPMAVAKGNKIYVLVVNDAMQKNDGNNEDWNFELAVGEVRPTIGSQGTGKTVVWQTPLKLSNLTEDVKNRLLNIPSRDNSAFLTEDGRIVFVVKVNRRRRDTFAIIYSNGTENETELESSYIQTPIGCISPYFFTWEKKLMMVTRCSDGITRVKESFDMGKTWTDGVWPSFKTWNEGQLKGEFTTATVANKTLLLFAQARDEITDGKLIQQIYLMFTDGNLTHDVGPVVVDDVKPIIVGGLLYTNDELFLLYQKVSTEPTNICFMHLKRAMERVKFVLRSWG